MRFSTPNALLADLDVGGAASLIAAAADITLVLDSAGQIEDLSVYAPDLLHDLGEGAATWIGRSFMSTVAVDSRPKVEGLLRDAVGPGQPRWRHVNHLRRDGTSIPVLYCCVPYGAQGRMIGFGRDLRDLSQLQQRLVAAQQTMERDYAKLRDVETRYRLLFQLSGEAVLIVDAARLRVTEANAQARAMFGVEVGDLAGLGLGQLFADDSLLQVEAHLSAVRAGVRVDDAAVRIEARGQAPREALVKASFFRQEGEALFLLRVAPPAGTPGGSLTQDARAKLLTAVERAPDGFVVSDEDGRVIAANAAFLELAQVAHEETIRGRPLESWIGKSGVDMTVLLASLRQRGSVRFFVSMLQGEEGGTTQVEISAVSIRSQGEPCYGFAIRNIEPRIVIDAPAPARALSRSVEQLTELIGQVPLKDLVREATEVIEKLCIEAALDLTSNNRASAAEMLGLSRQSLYVKLRRYGLGGSDESEEE